jgi:hypothetical protein
MYMLGQVVPFHFIQYKSLKHVSNWPLHVDARSEANHETSVIITIRPISLLPAPYRYQATENGPPDTCFGDLIPWFVVRYCSTFLYGFTHMLNRGYHPRNKVDIWVAHGFLSSKSGSGRHCDRLCQFKTG